MTRIAQETETTGNGKVNRKDAKVREGREPWGKGGRVGSRRSCFPGMGRWTGCLPGGKPNPKPPHRCLELGKLTGFRTSGSWSRQSEFA